MCFKEWLLENCSVQFPLEEQETSSASSQSSANRSDSNEECKATSLCTQKSMALSV